MKGVNSLAPFEHAPVPTTPVVDSIRFAEMMVELTPAEAAVLVELWEAENLQTAEIQERIIQNTTLRHARATERALCGIRQRLPGMLVSERQGKLGFYHLDPDQKKALTSAADAHHELVSKAQAVLSDWASDYLHLIVNEDPHFERKELYHGILSGLIENTGWWQSAEQVLTPLPGVTDAKNENFTRVIQKLSVHLPTGVIVQTGNANRTRYQIDPTAILALDPAIVSDRTTYTHVDIDETAEVKVEHLVGENYAKTYDIRSQLGVLVLSVLAGSTDWMAKEELKRILTKELGLSPSKEKLYRALTTVARHGVIEIKTVPAAGKGNVIKLVRLHPTKLPEHGPFLTAEQEKARKKAYPKRSHRSPVYGPKLPKNLRVPTGPKYGPPKPRAPRVKPPKVPTYRRGLPDKGKDTTKPIQMSDGMQLVDPKHIEIVRELRLWLEGDETTTIRELQTHFKAAGKYGTSKLVDSVIRNYPLYFRIIDDRVELSGFARKRRLSSVK